MVLVSVVVHGSSFVETHRLLVSEGVPAGSAFTTVMRATRAGGLTNTASRKDLRSIEISRSV